MRLLLGVTSAAAYTGMRLAAGAVGGAALGAVLTWRSFRQHRRTDWLVRP
jgi:hypothetical protein